MTQDGRLVYSTDPKLNQKCSKCKEVLSECTCAPEDDAKTYRFVAYIYLSTAGRAGKTVTVIDELPKNELFLKDLTKTLKQKCGSGGSYFMDGKEGRIEIQGDKRTQVRAILTAANIRTKGQ